MSCNTNDSYDLINNDDVLAFGKTMTAISTALAQRHEFELDCINDDILSGLSCTVSAIMGWNIDAYNVCGLKYKEYLYNHNKNEDYAHELRDELNNIVFCAEDNDNNIVHVVRASGSMISGDKEAYNAAKLYNKVCENASDNDIKFKAHILIFGMFDRNAVKNLRRRVDTITTDDLFIRYANKFHDNNNVNMQDMYKVFAGIAEIVSEIR